MNPNQTTIYLSGKITGVPDLNRPKFEKATKLLRSLGYIVRNPHELCADIDQDARWEVFMCRCVKALPDCDLLLTLDDWQDSRGAKLERALAVDLGITCAEFDLFVSRHLLPEGL